VITRLSYAVGENGATADQSQDAGRLISPAATLKEAGFDRHHMAAEGTSTYDLAGRAVAQLESREGELRDVDAILYASCIPANQNLGNVAAFTDSRDVKYLMDYPGSHLQSDFKMERAILFGLTQQACTGLLGSLRMAKWMIQCEPEMKKILVLTADRFPPGALYEQSYNLISDGAAAALVEAGGEGFEILSGHQLTNGSMAQASDDETVGHFFGYTSRLVQEGLRRAQLGIQDIRWVVPQNTNSKAWQILGRLLGFPFEKVALRTLSTVGHMISGDNIVNLQALERAGEVQPGDRLLLLMAGYGLNWQSLTLQRTEKTIAGEKP
jgi:3-oxoacyl-[acyl-carrier-protein] synthase-3